ncbi:MAG TPA: 3,4-dihydroxyphenylacetate 2,3-dioxygenase [Acidimicrobiales bacterium]|nr:3,4-dihydroxyphenylacetate 2,3-dioxygenase [Acidimicrobiales bacterium]
MGEIIGAGLVAHVPTIVLPEAVRLELNEGHEISLVPGLHRLKAEVLDRLRPDTIIVFDSHWFTTVEFVVTGHERRTGRFTSDELPRGMSGVPYDVPGDPELARLMADEVNAAGSWMTAIDDPHLPIHYATVNLLGFLQGDERWITVSLPQTGETDDFLLAGEAIGRAIARSDRRVVLLASGAMSHRFWPLKQLRAHEASDPVHIRTPEAREADLERLAWFEAGDHARVLDTMPEFLRHKPEGNFGHYLQMVAALGGRDCRAPGTRYSDYENSIGTGQVHVWFERPAGGWTAADAA